MKTRNIFQLLLKIIIYLLSYLLIFSHLHLFGLVLCLSYTAVIFLLPFGTNPVRVMLFAFAAGLLVDIYHSTLGIHTAACVLMAFFRANLLNWMVPAGGYEDYMTVSISSMGLKWFFPYAFILVFLHHCLYFFIDTASLIDFPMLMVKILATTMFTIFTIVLLQLGIEPPGRGD
jgi:hypothetical protein